MFNDVTVRIAFNDSVAKPPAAAYCSSDLVVAAVIALIIKAAQKTIEGNAASNTTVSCQQR